MLLQLAVGLRAALVRAGKPGLGLDGEPGVLHTLPVLLLLVVAVGNITAKISNKMTLNMTCLQGDRCYFFQRRILL